MIMIVDDDDDLRALFFILCISLALSLFSANPSGKKVKTPSHTDINQFQIGFRINILKLLNFF